MSGSTCYRQTMALKISCSDPRFALDFMGKADFVLFLKAQITGMKINFPMQCFMNYVRVSVRSSLQCFIWLKLKTVKIYSVVKGVKLLLVLSIYTQGFHL